MMYGNGEGAPRDDALAATLFRRSAEKGNAAALFNLAVMYHVGSGVPSDDVIAYALADTACRLDNEVQARVGGQRDDIARSLNSLQLASAHRLSEEIATNGLDRALDDYVASSTLLSNKKSALLK
jgi:TPR repeat protein